MEASKKFSSGVFVCSFLIAFLSFLVVTVAVLEVASPGQFVGHVNYGWPFAYYIGTDFGGYYYLPGLVGNVFFAVGLSFVLGLLSSFIWK